MDNIIVATNKMEILRKMFQTTFSQNPTEYEKIQGGGSNREYFRLKGQNVSAVAMICEDVRENLSFLNIDKMLEKEGVRVPLIYCCSEDKKAFLLQDLGNDNLFENLEKDNKIELSYKALNDLIDIQLIPQKKWITLVQYKPFSKRLVKWDLNYFKYDFLKVAGIEFDEEKLEDDFDKLANELTDKEMVTGFMYRDFQSRNIMVKDGLLWYIDFQGARIGPLVYDAVSFIWQAKAPFNLNERKMLQNFYSQKLGERLALSSKVISYQFDKMIIFRALQVLGAYGFRGIIERKAHFIESIPKAVANLEYLLQNGFLDEWKEIKKVALNIINWQTEFLSLIDNDFIKRKEEGILRVSVFSFSYKKGYPQDFTGNGGGFMFDCRALPNPGRYEEYKFSTGLDKEVEEYMVKTDDAKKFINNSLELVVPSVRRYINRGFTDLQVGFGCTGGQHRSVYCAEQFARALKRMYPEIRLLINHREQKIKKTL